MRHTDTKDFKWKYDNLLFKNKLFMNIIEDAKYRNMWRVVYPDGVLSKDFYNKTRAKENCLGAAMQIKGKEWVTDTGEEAL